MEIDFDKLKQAQADPKNKAVRKYLSSLSEDFRRENPERYAAIIKNSYSQEPCRTLAQCVRRARAMCVVALVLAAAVVISAYLLGDFGAALLTGWANRYLLSGAIVLAMGILVLAGLYNGRARDRLLAAVLLEENEKTERDI